MKHSSPQARICVLGVSLGIVLLLWVSCYKGNGLRPTASEPGSGIRGRILFTGAWPDSTRDVVIVVSKKYPKGITNKDSLFLFVFMNILNGNMVVGDTIPKHVSYYDYQISLNPGVYEWVLVAWFPDIGDYFMGVKELGAFYRMGGPQTTPSPVYVMPGVVMEGINMLADFSNVKRQVPFFKASKKQTKK